MDYHRESEWFRFAACDLRKIGRRRSGRVITRELKVRASKAIRGKTEVELRPVSTKPPVAFRFNGPPSSERISIERAMQDLVNIDLPKDTGEKPPAELQEYLVRFGPLGLVYSCAERVEYHLGRHRPEYQVILRRGHRFFDSTSVQLEAYIRTFMASNYEQAIGDGYCEPWELAYELIRELQLAAADQPSINDLNAEIHSRPYLIDEGDGLEWRFAFPSLLDALWMELAVGQAEGWPWKTCKNPDCRRLFFQTKANKFYCNSACREKAAGRKAAAARKTPLRREQDKVRARLALRWDHGELTKDEEAAFRTQVNKVRSVTQLKNLIKENEILKPRK